MGIIELGYKITKHNLDLRNIFSKADNFEDILKDLSKFLNDLKILEASFWGVNITQIKNDEDKIIEDTNHLIYLISRDENNKLTKILKNNDVKDFFKSLNKLNADFKYLKKKVNKRDKLKNLITKLSIKLVDKNHFKDLENIFILEKQLYNVLDRQDVEFNNILFETSKLKFDSLDDLKVDTFIEILKNIRKVLGGHLEHHKLWEEERFGFSNTSNIIYSLIKNVNNLKNKNNLKE